MRIIAGKWRGRKIDVPAGRETRPTADRVRETLFSMLASRLGSFEDLQVADLFAGSGALGFEAMSRGAARVTFVESDQGALRVIRSNAAKLGVSDDARILAGSALALPHAGPFDLILSDPPYSETSGNEVRAAVERADWLAPGGWLSIETGGGTVEPGGLLLDAERAVGRARLTLLRLP